jgi:hypothetical protein
LWAYWPILRLHKTAVSIAQNSQFFKLYQEDGWTNNHFVVSVLIIQFWSVLMQQVNMLDPMEKEVFFDLNFVIYLSEMLNEEWIFAFKYDILMNSMVVVLTLKCVNHF